MGCKKAAITALLLMVVAATAALWLWINEDALMIHGLLGAAAAGGFARDEVTPRIIRCSQYLSPPFDVLLGDPSSELFQQVLRRWPETQALVDSPAADPLLPRIAAAIADPDEVMLHSMMSYYDSLADKESPKGAARAPILQGVGRFSDKRHLFDFLETLNDTVVFADHFNENWGLFSVAFVHPKMRTVNWNDQLRDPRYRRLVTENDNVVAFFTVQHHNYSDPQLDNKVLSMPLGVQSNDVVWPLLSSINTYNNSNASSADNTRRDALFDFALTSNIKRFRVEMFCWFLKSNFSTPANDRRVEKEAYVRRLRTTKFIWTPSGLGGDCYRNWESLYFGAIPVMERGMGLERTMAYLPVFFVDNYFQLKREMLEDAYPLFVALREEFRFERLRKSYWRELIYSVAQKKSADELRWKHPFAAHRVIWPHVPDGMPIPEQQNAEGPRGFDLCPPRP